MIKNSTFYIFVSLLFLLSSCHIFRSRSDYSPNNRKPPAPRSTVYNNKSGSSRSSSGRPPSNNRNSATSPSRPLASRPSGTYSSNVPEVVKVARTYTGTPYRSGGNDKNGIDCSGLICSVYSEIGVKVPRISWQQSEFGKEISKIDEIRPGDWIFFVPESGTEGYVSHSGIVTEIRGEKDIVFIHASSSKGVREDNLFSNYFKNRFVKAMRPF